MVRANRVGHSTFSPNGMGKFNSVHGASRLDIQCARSIDCVRSIRNSRASREYEPCNEWSCLARTIYQ